MNTLNQILRPVLFFALTLVGMFMAVIFMLSTAVVIAILYLVARISGRPFAVKSYWDQRTRSKTRPNFYRDDVSKPTVTQDNKQNITDIEMREIP